MRSAGWLFFCVGLTLLGCGGDDGPSTPAGGGEDGRLGDGGRQPSDAGATPSQAADAGLDASRDAIAPFDAGPRMPRWLGPVDERGLPVRPRPVDDGCAAPASDAHNCNKCLWLKCCAPINSCLLGGACLPVDNCVSDCRYFCEE